MNWKIGRSVGRDILDTAFFAALKVNGIDSVELSMPQDKYDTYDYAAIRSCAEEAGVEIFSFHLPFLPFEKLDPSAPDEALRISTVAIQ